MFYSRAELINLMREHHFRPRKRWGQNFLIDKNIRDKIITAAGLRKNDTVLEIGPGLGALTEALSRRVERVIAVERDEKLCAILKELFTNQPNLKIISTDILKFNFANLSARVIGNLPYYITSPIIVHLLKARASIDSIIITVQKEVAQRLLSQAGESSYGAISCFVQFYSAPSLIMQIKKGAFYPSPKVDSSLVKLEILDTPKVRVENEPLFFKIIRASFNQRRKMLLNCLSSSLKLGKPFLLKILEATGISPQRRGETLSLEEFAKIANSLKRGQVSTFDICP